MTKHILVVGCSFVALLNDKKLSIEYPDLKFDIRGMSASGNQTISSAVLNGLSNNHYDAVVVLWSGINRIDAPLGKTVHDSIYYNQNKPCFSRIDDTYWYHSGGFGCLGLFPPTPTFLIEYFKSQYKEPAKSYLSDLSLNHVILTHNLIKAIGINSYCSFIYNIHADYDLKTDKLFQHSLDYTLGQVDKDSSLYKLLLKTPLALDNTPYEWAYENNLLDEDEFHPTPQAMHDWFCKFVIGKLKL